ncbi:MAG: thermonuclease family protein [Alphaproteobacteria bacterium]|nr:thermonuclease family protein [Alphaproteobacteria bacterium]
MEHPARLILAVFLLICFSIGVGTAFPTTTQAAGSRSAVLSGPVAAQVLRVIDGDTVRVRATVWLGSTVEIDVRLAGIDAPEIRGRCAREKQLAASARDALLFMLGDGPIVLHDVRYGKYAGRVIARIIAADGRDVSETLQAQGLARPYTGGKRARWCDA